MTQLTQSQRNTFRQLITELLIFTKKQAYSALFGGIILISLVITRYVTIPGIHRYDLLFIIAILTQAWLILKKYEEPREVLVIALFHVAAMAMEIFKTSPAVGSWTYPEPSFFSIYTVPLFTGFMYSAIGSYIVRSWRINEFKFTHLPRKTILALFGLAIYVNFFTNHFTYDVRYILFALLIVAFWRTTFDVKLTERVYRIHPLLSNGLFAFIIWMSEQVGTLAQAWVYPEQTAGWKPVSFHMFTSWYMLLVFSFILIALVVQSAQLFKKHKKPIIVVCGPTATGKSDLAVDIALYIKEKYGKSCEIISTDSRQIYIGLNIGTGKITPPEMHDVPHHLLDIAHPNEKISVVEIQQKAQKCIEEIYGRGNVPILCGGTGMYIDSIVYHTEFPDVPPNQSIRDALETCDTAEIKNRFDAMCQEYHITSHSVDTSNKRRMIRAIEIISALGYIPQLKKHDDVYDICWIGLDMDDADLQQRIKNRINLRINAGMIKESEHLLASGTLTHARMQELGLEYAYISDLLSGKISRAEFDEQLYFAIWHYAKRQRTWFRKNKNIQWFNLQSAHLQSAKYQDVFDTVSKLINKTV